MNLSATFSDSSAASGSPARSPTDATTEHQRSARARPRTLTGPETAPTRRADHSAPEQRAVGSSATPAPAVTAVTRPRTTPTAASSHPGRASSGDRGSHIRLPRGLPKMDLTVPPCQPFASRGLCTACGDPPHQKWHGGERDGATARCRDRRRVLGVSPDNDRSNGLAPVPVEYSRGSCSPR
jgi:hypothetical protein